MTIVNVKNKKNGVTYVYESVGYWDKEKQQARSKRKCIGKLNDETGEIIYSKSYLESKELEEIKANIKSETISTEPEIRECKRSFVGATHLLDEIGSKLGIADDLKKCFPEIHEQIRSLAYYLVMEDRNPMSRFPKWSRTHSHPYGRDIPSQRSSELLELITEDSKINFFKMQSQRRLETEYLAYDTTSISSYSKTLKQVKYGHNKDHDPLAQINLALLFGEKSRLPVYYRKLPGNISDVKTINNLLADIDFLDLKKVKLVMDRGFYSKANIDALYKNHHKFLIAAKTSLKFVKIKLDEVRGKMDTRSLYSSNHKVYATSFTTTWDYSETKKSGDVIKKDKRLYMHIYYNEQRATDDKITFNRYLDILENELLSGKHNPKHENAYTKYYEVKTTPKRGITIIPKQDAIDAKLKNSGYFVLLSNGIKDKVEALDIYRGKDVVEKAFNNLKERLNMRRTSVSSDENLEGKLFIQFVALIYLSYIKKQMSDNDLFKKYTLQEVIDEIDVIEKFDYPGNKVRVGEVTKKQEGLFNLLGVNSPTLL
jgi:transposase